MPEVISQIEAHRLGLKRYFTNEPCMRGHISERQTSSKQCVRCKSDAVKAQRPARTASTTAWRRKNPERWIWQTTKDRAKKRGMEFSLVPEDIVIPSHCPVLGLPLSTQQGGKFCDNSASIDRIHNDRGYTKDNIVIVSWLANRLKSNGTIDQLKAIVAFYESI